MKLTIVMHISCEISDKFIILWIIHDIYYLKINFISPALQYVWITLIALPGPHAMLNRQCKARD